MPTYYFWSLILALRFENTKQTEHNKYTTEVLKATFILAWVYVSHNCRLNFYIVVIHFPISYLEFKLSTHIL